MYWYAWCCWCCCEVFSYYCVCRTWPSWIFLGSGIFVFCLLAVVLDCPLIISIDPNRSLVHYHLNCRSLSSQLSFIIISIVVHYHLNCRSLSSQLSIIIISIVDHHHLYCRKSMLLCVCIVWVGFCRVRST
jgi:hypothetical protein